jgi:BirA family biotin operon repressor/biotin-[acetyl-CoA-carboxylase] ligase
MHTVSENVRGTIVGKEFRYYDEIRSTAAQAEKLARECAPEGTIVIAEAISRSRGSGASLIAPHKGIVFSLLLRPCMPKCRVSLLLTAFVVTLARTVEGIANMRASIRWPGEVYLDDKRTGIVTCSASYDNEYVEWLVINVDLNVNTVLAEMPVRERRANTSLEIATGRVYDRSYMLETIVRSFEKCYSNIGTCGFANFITDFRQRDYLASRRVSLDTRHGSVVGVAAGIDDLGALLIESVGRRTQSFDSTEATLRQLI